MNQKKAKKLRRAARLAVLRSELFDAGRDYQVGRGGSVTLRPTTERAVYQGLKEYVR